MTNVANSGKVNSGFEYINFGGDIVNNNKLRKYKKIIDQSFDIVKNIVSETSYPTIIMDKFFQVVFVNELALRLYNKSFEETYMKNYFGIFCSDEREYDEFTDFYNNIIKNKEPVYVDNDDNDTYLMIFPILSAETGEVEYFHNVFLLEEIHMTSSQKDDLSLNHDYVLFAHQLSVLLETKDKYTANHSSNVAKYSELLGMAIGIEGRDLKELKLAANLHDIGKVNIPNRILNKKEKLTVKEYEIIKDHARYSGEILGVFNKLGNVKPSGLYHHERFDGKGYPNNLVGRNIPLFARIIAIADCFDAMTTDRPYRSALPYEVAIKEIENNKNKQFDPFLVDKFINLELKDVMNSLADFVSEYTDKYTVPTDALVQMNENLKMMFEKIDPFVMLENMVNYNYYGFIISKDINPETTSRGNRFEILYKNGLVENLEYEKYLSSNWEMCLKEKQLQVCNYCPVDACIGIDSTFFKKAKLVSINGEVKYLDTLLHPVKDNDTSEVYILELFRDVTINIKYSSDTANEFFNFVDNLYRTFAKQNEEFSIIYNEMRGLCNWIAKKSSISEHKIELLNKALSICDLGIIALLDSNEYTFESLKKVRFNKKHIEIIYSMITKLETFADIKEIVLYHHTDYSDTRYELSGEQIPIQAYIISIADYLLTYTVMGTPIDETLHYLDALSGIQMSPHVCDSILHGDNREELILMLKRLNTPK